jgi:rubredoxin
MTNATTSMTQAELRSEITCPECGHRKTEEMPVDACQFFYQCEGCGSVLRPKAGDCCVFCSYGTVPCPPIQLEGQTGGGSSCCRAG